MDFAKFEMTLNQLGLNSLSLIQSSPDPEVAFQYLNGNKCLVPNRFYYAAYSSRRIGRIIFEILKENFGDQFVKNIQHTLQIGPDFFLPEFDQNKINTELYGSIYRILTTYFGFTEQGLFWLGQKTAFLNQGTEFTQTLNHKNLVKDYSYFLEVLTRQIEQSHNYDLKILNDNKVIIRKTLSERILDELKIKKYGNHLTCTYSIGFATTVGYFSCGVFPSAKKTASLYSNQNETIFEIDLKTFKTPSLFYPRLNDLQ
jgi:hypothetical protein